jgi:hypothetical protein
MAEGRRCRPDERVDLPRRHAPVVPGRRAAVASRPRAAIEPRVELRPFTEPRPAVVRFSGPSGIAVPGRPLYELSRMIERLRDLRRP